jgi:hypothetical protein
VLFGHTCPLLEGAGPGASLVADALSGHCINQSITFTARGLYLGVSVVAHVFRSP